MPLVHAHQKVSPDRIRAIALWRHDADTDSESCVVSLEETGIVAVHDGFAKRRRLRSPHYEPAPRCTLLDRQGELRWSRPVDVSKRLDMYGRIRPKAGVLAEHAVLATFQFSGDHFREVRVHGAPEALVCLDAEDGALRWCEPAAATRTPVGVPGGVLHVDTGKAGVVARELRDGAVRWTAAGACSTGPDGLYRVKDTAVVKFADRVVGFRPGSGAVRWEHPVELIDVDLTEDGRLISDFTTGDGRGQAVIALETGEWVARSGADYQHGLIGAARERVGFLEDRTEDLGAYRLEVRDARGQVVAEQRLEVPSEDQRSWGGLAALDDEGTRWAAVVGDGCYGLDPTRATTWRAPDIGGTCFGSLQFVLTDGGVLVRASDDGLLGLDALTGAERWRLEAEERFEPRVLVAGWLVALDPRGTLLFIDPDTGEIAREEALEMQEPELERALVADDSGFVAVIGGVLWGAALR